MGYPYTPSSASPCVSDSPGELGLYDGFFVCFGNIGVAVVTIFYLHFSFKSYIFALGRGME